MWTDTVEMMICLLICPACILSHNQCNIYCIWRNLSMLNYENFLCCKRGFNRVCCLLAVTGHLKKGARLELSLVRRLFNLGNNKNIKRIPVFLCYNRSTTEWKRRDSETKPMTSERSETVEEESTKGRAGRWRDGPSGKQAKGRDWCPCEVEEGSRQNWQRAVELLRETGETLTV